MFAPSSLTLRLAALSALACAVFLLASAAAEEKPSLEESKAQAALKRIEERIKNRAADQNKLRQELASFRLAHLGTRAAVRGAVLFSEFSSPLDRMDSKTIPAVEKFDWQPKELVGVLGEHRGRHGGAVTCVGFSPDGSVIASGGTHYVRTWNPATMRLQGLGGQTYVSCLAFSKDSKVLVTGSSYGSVYVWDLPRGGLKLRFHVAASTSPVYGVSCHPDGKIIACACFDNVVRLYDISGTAIKEAGQVSGHAKAVRSVAYSPDGKLLATGSEDLTARLWDTTGSDYKEKSRIEGHETSVVSLAFTKSGTTLATGCADGSIRLWPVPAAAKARNPRVQFQGPKGNVAAMSFSNTGSTLAATCGDSTVRLWNLSGGKLVKERFKLEGHQGVVQGVAYSPDMKMLVSGSDDWTVRTWDLTKAKPVERYPCWSHLSHVYSVAYSTDSASLATGSYDTIVRFWDLDRPEPRTRRYLKFEAPVYAVSYSPDGRSIAAGGQSTTVKQYHPTKNETRPACKNHPSYVYHLTYSPDSKYLLSASGKDVILYDTTRGSEVKRFGPHKTNVTFIGFSPDGKLALSGSGYYLYDNMNKIVVRNGKTVYHDCVLKLWDVDKGEEVAEAKEAETPYYAGAFSADGRMLLGGNYEPVLRRWDFASKKLTETTPWKGSSGYVHGIWPTPDGKHVLTRGLDSTLILWDAATGKRLTSWTFNETPGGVAVSADSRHIAVGLGTGVVYVLRIAPAKAKSS